MSEQPKAWTCKHGCERDALKDQIGALEFANVELLGTLKYLVNKVKATKMHLGPEMYGAESLIRQYEKAAEQETK